MLNRRRRLCWAALVLGVVLAHLWLAEQLAQSLRLGAELEPAMRRIDVSFVRELQQERPPPPPAAATKPPPPAGPALAAAPAAAASAPAGEPPAALAQAESPSPEPARVFAAPAVDAGAPGPFPAPAPGPAAAPGTGPSPLPLPGSEGPSPTTATATAEARPAAPSRPEGAAPQLPSGGASGSSFEWPPSTRLSYTLTGDYRGPIEGSARVEWLRTGSRYQVHLDVLLGPSFAPLVTRRMSSDGEITEQGLRPLRYEEETRVPLAGTRRKVVVFEPQRIVLQGPKEVPTLAGVQDTASQFVQLTWLFTTQPHRLKVGDTVVVPLALPHRVDRWVYEVSAEEAVETPVGRIPAFYIKPRREQQKAGELAIEAWFAPTLQYLPVRIMIRQDAQTYADLLLQRLPQQAAR